MLNPLRGIILLRSLWSLSLARGLSILIECPEHPYIDMVPSTFNCTLSEDWSKRCKEGEPVSFKYTDRAGAAPTLCTTPSSFAQSKCGKTHTPGSTCPGCKCECAKFDRDVKYTLHFVPTIRAHNSSREFSCDSGCSKNSYEKTHIRCRDIKVLTNPCLTPNNPCRNNGTCRLGTPGAFSVNYTCSCMSGFSGLRCESGPCERPEAYCRKGETCMNDYTTKLRYICCPSGKICVPGKHVSRSTTIQLFWPLVAGLVTLATLASGYTG